MPRKQPADWGSLAGLLVVRPLTTVLPEPTWGGHYSSPFSAPFADTLRVLRREVEHLRPREVILEAAFREDQLRNDGLPKAGAAALPRPGVILTLVGTPHGDLRYPCSTFHAWDDNLRGIALALEALRKVDRYGVTKRGEQYQGWKALPSPQSSLVERGRQLIREHGDARKALAATHPDTHPDDPSAEEDFKAVSAARDADG